MYIRTKDGRILDFDKLNEVSKLSIDMAEEPIRESENIEDLCDEFVVFDKEQPNGKLLYYKGFENLKKEFIDFEKDKEKVVVCGAIWTDKGLIYVAKMNDKGELVLIWAIYGIDG